MTLDELIQNMVPESKTDLSHAEGTNDDLLNPYRKLTPHIRFNSNPKMLFGLQLPDNQLPGLSFPKLDLPDEYKKSDNESMVNNYPQGKGKKHLYCLPLIHLSPHLKWVQKYHASSPSSGSKAPRIPTTVGHNVASSLEYTSARPFLG